MKGCDGCGECCRLLDVQEIQKPKYVECSALRRDLHGNARCGVQEQKPSSCVAFFCLWLMSQMRPNPGEALPDLLRPDKSHVIFYRNGTEQDPRVVFLEVDPKFPNAWAEVIVQVEINRLKNRGAIIVVQIGDDRVIIQKDQPIVRTHAATAAQMAGRRFNWKRPRMAGVS